MIKKKYLKKLKLELLGAYLLDQSAVCLQNFKNRFQINRQNDFHSLLMRFYSAKISYLVLFS